MFPQRRFPTILAGGLAFAGFLGAGYWSGKALFSSTPSTLVPENASRLQSTTPQPPSPATAEIDALGNLAPEEFPAMFDAIASDEDDRSGQRLRMRMLFARWVEIAPEEGLALVRARDEGWWMGAYIEEWARADPSGAEAMLVRTAGDKDMKYVYGSLMRLIAARDPEAYFEMRKSETFFETSKKGSEFQSMGEDKAFGELAKTNPARAAEIFASFEFGENDDRDQAAGNLAREWARQNPNAALEWASSLKSEQGWKGAWNAALEGLAERDPHAAAKALTEFTLATGETLHPLKNFPSMIEDAITTITGKLAKEDFGAAMRWLNENVSNPSLSLLEHAAKYLPTDLTSLHSVLSSVENPERRRQLFFNTTVIPAADAASYAQQAAALPSGEVRDAILGHALATWARSDLASVSAFISEKAPALASDPAFLNNLLLNVPPAQSAQALALVQVGAPASLPSDFLKEVAIRHPAALAETLPSMADGPGRTSAFETLANQWALAAPTTAATWATGLTGADAEAAQRSLATSWAHWDSYATSQWIAELPRGAARDGAVTALIAEVVPDEPDSAFAWAVTLENAEQRAAGLGQAFQAWHATNPTQAAAALRGAALTPEERARLSALTTQP